MPRFLITLFQFLLTVNPKNRKGFFATVVITVLGAGAWYLLPVEYKDDFEHFLESISVEYVNPNGGENDRTNFESRSDFTG